MTLFQVSNFLFSTKKFKNLNALKQFLAKAFLLFLVLIFAFSTQVSWAKSKKMGKSPKTPKSKKIKELSEESSTSDETLLAGAWKDFGIGTEKEKKQAISRLKSVLKKDPQNALIHYYLGLMLFQEGPLTQAQEHLEFAAQVYTTSADIQFKLGEIFFNRKKMAEALEHYQKALDFDPNHGGTLLKQGLLALDANDPKKAIDLLSRARVVEPQNGEVIRGLGAAFFATERFAEAIDVLKLALKFDENNPEVHYLLGKSYEGIGKSKEAAEELERATALGARDLKQLVGYDLARRLYDTGKVEAAINEYKECIKKSDDPATGWFELGKIYEDTGDNPQAIKAFQKAFELDGRSEAPYRIGNIHHLNSKLQEAIDAFSLIVRKKDGWGERAQYEIDEIKDEMRQNRIDELIDIAQSSSEDKRESAYLNLLEIDKKNEFALTGLKDLATERGDLGKVEYYIKELRKAGHISEYDSKAQINELTYRSEAGEDLSAWENRVEEFKRQGDWDKAIREHKKIVEYTNSQLLHWQKYSPRSKEKEELRKEMLKATRYRLKLLKAEAKDLQSEKKRHK